MTVSDGLSEPSARLVSVVTGSFNEADNVQTMYERLCAVFAKLPQYRFEIIWIDNHSTDDTVARLKAIAARDPRLKLIVNTRNFGAVRSGYHALLQARGDAAVLMASDLQDPPELIEDFLVHWERGFNLVLARKTASRESPLFYLMRTIYYKTINRFADIALVEHVTGFGLYAQRVIEDLRRIDDPYPYLRGLVSDLGYPHALVDFTQPRRLRGVTTNNFYTLYDLAMLGLTNHSKVPLRLATMAGFATALLTFLIGLGYLVAKLVFWQSFTLGTAPVVVGLFFFASVQLFFTGVVGEYIASIHTQVLKRPHVIEAERVNFEVDATGTAPAATERATTR